MGAGVLLLGLALIAALPARAQLYQFGKNKVHYDEFAWQRLESAHFDVYFYPEEEALASSAAHMAEEGYRALEARLGYGVRRRVPLIVYSSHIYFQQTNIIPGLLPEGVAGFTEYLKGRVALPLSGSYPEFERVLHHELVHVFMFARIRAVLDDRHLTDVWYGPLWFSEGLAEYLSARPGPPDSYGEMILRDALFSQRLASIAEMDRIHGSFQMYKEGESICRFMAGRYGEDVFARLLDNWWRGETFDEVFRATTGETVADLDEAWVYDLRKRLLPEIADADPPSQLARALTETGYNLKPAVVPVAGPVAPDSVRYLSFHADEGYTAIVSDRVGGGDRRTVVAGERDPQFESLHPLSASLAVAADGRRLAFAAQRGGRDHLIVWDLAGGRLERRYAFDDLVALSGPTWSPDGRTLAFSGARRSGSTDLFTVDVDSGRLTALTDDLYDDREPDWHPRRGVLAFASDRAPEHGRQGRRNLFLYDLEAPGIRQLTAGDWDDDQPAWSPDGERLAFSSDRDGAYDLYLLPVRVEADGAARGAERRLTRALTGAFDPAWLPAGDELLFTGFEASRFQVYRLAAGASPDSAALATVAAAPADGPTWSLAGLADRGAVTRRAYRRKLTLDVAQSQISQDPLFGTSGGIQVALSDVLGDVQYYMVLSQISGSAGGFVDGLNFALGRYHLARRVNAGWGVFHLNDRLTSSFGRFVSEKRTGGWAEVSYPFDRHDRLEASATARHTDIDRQFEGRRLTGWLLSNHVSYTHDSSLWIPTGPLEGTRYSLGAGHTVDLKSSRPYNATLFADYRRYARLGRRSCVAVRYMGLRSSGDVPEFFSIGGSWTLRGYAFRSLWGRNVALANHELRFPLLDRMVLAFPFGRIDLSALRGALFADAGNAWNERFGDWKGSLGVGWRLALGGVFVFRLDASRRTDFASIENQTRWEFFFGWDY